MEAETYAYSAAIRKPQGILTIICNVMRNARFKSKDSFFRLLLFVISCNAILGGSTDKTGANLSVNQPLYISCSFSPPIQIIFLSLLIRLTRDC